MKLYMVGEYLGEVCGKSLLGSVGSEKNWWLTIQGIRQYAPIVFRSMLWSSPDSCSRMSKVVGANLTQTKGTSIENS